MNLLHRFAFFTRFNMNVLIDSAANRHLTCLHERYYRRSSSWSVCFWSLNNVSNKPHKPCPFECPSSKRNPAPPSANQFPNKTWSNLQTSLSMKKFTFVVDFQSSFTGFAAFPF